MYYPSFSLGFFILPHSPYVGFFILPHSPFFLFSLDKKDRRV
jgi:hypothetical protein